MNSLRTGELLLVEDSDADLELTLRALKSINLLDRVHVVRDGKEAVDYLSTGARHGAVNRQLPKVIMLDLKLPKIDGVDVLRMIRSNPRTKKIPVVVLTSSREESDLNACYELGVNSYIAKPFNLEEFVKSVSTAGLYWLVVNQPPG